MNVSQIMNTSPGRIAPKERLRRALDMMAEEKGRHVVVLDDVERVVGILSDRDLAMYYDPVNMTEERWDEATVEQLMSPDPICIGSRTEIQAAAKLLLSSAVSALPVVDNGSLVGIITEKDFVRYFANGERAQDD